MAGVPQQIITGARVILHVNGNPVGLFTSCNWSLAYDLLPNFTLGNYGPVELSYAGQDAVSISATGFRILQNGAYVVAGVPKLSQLMSAGEITIAIVDRQTGAVIMNVTGVRSSGYSTSVSARSISDFTVNFLGKIITDESNTSDGDTGGIIAAPGLLSGTSTQASST